MFENQIRLEPVSIYEEGEEIGGLGLSNQSKLSP